MVVSPCLYLIHAYGIGQTDATSSFDLVALFKMSLGSIMCENWKLQKINDKQFVSRK